MDTAPEDTVRDYYDALRNGDPLESSFLEDESTVKFGISEALFGYDEVAEALREQTETTAEWTVDSHGLEVATHDAAATFADEVTMAWRDVDGGEEYEFETRWSGTLVPAPGDENEWRFAVMHVSTAGTM